MSTDADYFSNIVLLHCNGTDGSQVILDSSAYNHTVTLNGFTDSIHLTTAQFKFGAASLTTDYGGNGWLSIAVTDPASSFGTGDFTLEYQARPAADTTSDISLYGTSNIISLSLIQGYGLYAQGNSDAIDYSREFTVAADTWHHVAVVRLSGVVKVFFNGIQQGADIADATNYDFDGTIRVRPGTFTDEIRITKGIARYTADFTPPTEEFADNAGTAGILGHIPIQVLANAVMLKSPWRIIGNTAITVMPGSPLLRVTPLELGVITQVGSFRSSLTANISGFKNMAVNGGAFVSGLDCYFGGNVKGGAFKSVLDATITGIPSFFITGGSFKSSLAATIGYETHIQVAGGAFKSSLESNFGWNAQGGGFASSLSAEISGWASMAVAGGAFKSSLHCDLTGYYGINIAGGAFKSQLLWMDIAGGGFKTELNAHIDVVAENSVGFVLNVNTDESWRWTNQHWNHIITIGQKYYGVTGEGLWLLEGDTDNGAAINSTILTKDSDMGSFKSKNCPAIYLDSDTLTQVTPLVDSVRKGAYPSKFNSRKTALGLGPSGRFWQFEIQGIKQLSAYEVLVNEKQRRVK